MSLFVLREGYRVTSAPEGGRVVHVSTGKTVELSPEELQVLARATAGGIDAREPEVRALIRKFVQLGILISAREIAQSALRARASAPPQTKSPASSVRYKLRVRPSSPDQGAEAPRSAAPAGGASPKPVPEDTVRLFRRDLRVSRRPSSPLYEVSDPIAGKTFPLYDFEVSLARMLDGRRQYSEIVEAGQRLGIPVNFESLLQFVRQLDIYGFLAPPGSQLKESREASVWAPRRQWDEGLRALFQSGLRMHRQGRYAEAANYFEAMLEQDPQNPEALEMLEQARQRLPSTSEEDRQEAAVASDPAQVSLTDLVLDDAPELEEERSEGELTEQEPTEAESPAEPVSDRAPSKRGIPSGALTTNPVPSRKKKVLLWLLAVVAITGSLVGGGAWYLQSLRDELESPASRLRARAKKRPPAVAPGRATTAQATAPLDGGEGPVTAVLAPPDAGGVDSGTSALREAIVPMRAPAASAEAINKLQIPLVAIKGITARVERNRRPKIADVRAPADGLLTWKASSRHPVRRGEVVGAVQEKETGKEHWVVAPKEGVLIRKMREGTKTKKSKKVGSVLSSQVELQTSVGDPRPGETWACEVVSESLGIKAHCKVLTVVARGSRYQVTVEAESPEDFDEVADAVLRLSPPAN